MKTVFRGALCGAMLLALHQAGTITGLTAQALKQFTPYSEAQPIFDALRSDLLPAELRDASTRESSWSAWVRQHDAAIRARVAAGDEDSIIHLLLFGTSFTKAPRASERDLAALVTTPEAALRTLAPRIEDFAAAVTTPGTNERLRFARRVVEGKGIDPRIDSGKAALRRYLEERTRIVGGSVQSSRLLNPATDLSEKLTLFRERGLSSDTSVFIDFGIEQALDAMKATGALRAGSVRRAALVGPGLDFADKLDGYDFYPEQTIQPFALIDSLVRLDLADTAGLTVAAFDVSPRVVQHLDDARARARAASRYSVVLPRNTDRPWSEELVDYWQRFGNWIGEPVEKTAPPASAGAVDVRTISIRPDVVLAATPVDLNIVTQQFEESGSAPFDLVVATNILLYYDVFEQSLAAGNIAKMLKPGGFLLTNNRIFELPGSPLSGVGFIDVVYMSLPGVGDTGDRIVWYQKQ